MRSSPIYNVISNASRASDCSFGSVDGYGQDIRVGTSSRNSHTLAKIRVSRAFNDDGTTTFRLFVDGVCIRKGTLAGKQFSCEEIA